MDIRIKSIGDQKVHVIRVIREATGWGLKEAKDFVDSIEYGEGVLPNVSDSVLTQLHDLNVDCEPIGANVIQETPNYESNTGATKDSAANAVGQDSSKSDGENAQFVPIFSLNMISSLDREDTLKLLTEVKNIANEYEEYNRQIQNYSAAMGAEKATAEELRKKLSDKGCRIIIGITIICSLVCLFNDAGILGTIFIGVAAAYFFLSCLYVSKSSSSISMVMSR